MALSASIYPYWQDYVNGDFQLAEQYPRSIGESELIESFFKGYKYYPESEPLHAPSGYTDISTFARSRMAFDQFDAQGAFTFNSTNEYRKWFISHFAVKLIEQLNEVVLPSDLLFVYDNNIYYEPSEELAIPEFRNNLIGTAPDGSVEAFRGQYITGTAVSFNATDRATVAFRNATTGTYIVLGYSGLTTKYYEWLHSSMYTGGRSESVINVFLSSGSSGKSTNYELQEPCDVKFILYYVNAYGGLDWLPVKDGGAVRYITGSNTLTIRTGFDGLNPSDPQFRYIRKAGQREWALNIGSLIDAEARKLYHLVNATHVWVQDLQAPNPQNCYAVMNSSMNVELLDNALANDINGYEFTFIEAREFLNRQ